MDATHPARFDPVATLYARHVAPLFTGPVARLLELAALQAGERVLDIGTGPGQAALQSAGRVGPGGSVTAVDLSEAMLAIGQQHAAAAGAKIDFRVADAERLDFPADAFDAVVSNFGLSGADPEKALASIQRILRPGGRLAFSHWGAKSRPAQAFYTLLGKRRVAEPSPRLAWLRATDPTTKAWEGRYDTTETLRGLLVSQGFREVQTTVQEFAFTFADADAYLEMALSFPLAQAEFQALSPGNQRMFRHELNALLAPYRGPNRSIVAHDPILFAVAVR